MNIIIINLKLKVSKVTVVWGFLANIYVYIQYFAPKPTGCMFEVCVFKAVVHMLIKWSTIRVLECVCLPAEFRIPVHGVNVEEHGATGI